jgi:F0F1-type ATP synthase membrane subunit b/b'
MEALRADYQARITQIEADARAHIQAAIREAQTERERLLTEAREHTETTLRQGIADIERDRAEALRSLKGPMADMALTAVGKALGPTADTASLRRSIETQIAQSDPGVGPARSGS